jgi:transcriptional regulator with XRE-family HTH domain
MNYSKAIRIVRAAKGLDQQVLAERTGLSKSLLSKIEAEKREMTETTKIKISEALNIPESLLDILAIEPNESKVSKKDLEFIGKSLLRINNDLSAK